MITDKKSKTKDKNDNVYRRTKTGALVISFICHGVYNEIVGPTLPDLKQRVGCDYEQISRVLSAKEAGLFIGSLLGGVVHDRWARRRDVIIAAALLISALTVTLMPWCTTLWVLAAVFYVLGHGHALLSTGANPVVAVLWKDKSDGPYQLLHMGFGIGAILGIFIAKPFISGGASMTNYLSENISLALNHSIDLFNNQNNTEDLISQIEYPYTISGIFCVLVSLVFIIYYFLPSPPQFVTKDAKWRDIFNPNRCSGGQTIFGTQMLILIFTFYMFIVAMERGFGKFIFTYAVESDLSLSKDAASLLGMMFWISFTVGRFTSFLLSRCVAPHILLFTQISGTLLASILLNIFADCGVAIYVLTIIFGFFKSQLYPTGLGWANKYIEISSMTIAVIDTGSSIGGIIAQWLTGYLIQYYGPHTFMYVIVSCSAASFLVFIVMHIVASRHGDRFSREKNAPPELNVDEAKVLFGSKVDIEKSKEPASLLSNVSNV